MLPSKHLPLKETDYIILNLSPIERGSQEIRERYLDQLEFFITRIGQD
ncbi:hypothetical protein LPE509_00493 [Legionella pneumophila subsp. pneumophila LPE509]|nr:hypothetical protein LPE509_00493 [Legionella pneumophila subsp. pneumophila LPE509]